MYRQQSAELEMRLRTVQVMRRREARILRAVRFLATRAVQNQSKHGRRLGLSAGIVALTNQHRKPTTTLNYSES